MLHPTRRDSKGIQIHVLEAGPSHSTQTSTETFEEPETYPDSSRWTNYILFYNCHFSL